MEFERVQAQLEAARKTADARAVPVEVQIISRARPSSEAISPRPLLLASLTAFAAGLLGLALLLTRELLRDWPRPGSGVVKRLGPSPRRAPSRLSLVAAAGRPAVRSAPPAFPTISSVARHLISEARRRTGFRTVVVGEAATTCAVDAAIDLARRLAEQGRHATLVDWRGHDAGTFGQAPKLGFTEVLLGRVSFEEAVGRLPNSNAHRIVARASAEGAAVSKDKDRVNMLFDALAEAYDHIVIGGPMRRSAS